jgi:hypothetical protein
MDFPRPVQAPYSVVGASAGPSTVKDQSAAAMSNMRVHAVVNLLDLFQERALATFDLFAQEQAALQAQQEELLKKMLSSLSLMTPTSDHHVRRCEEADHSADSQQSPIFNNTAPPPSSSTRTSSSLDERVDFSTLSNHHVDDPHVGSSPAESSLAVAPPVDHRPVMTHHVDTPLAAALLANDPPALDLQARDPHDDVVPIIDNLSNDDPPAVALPVGSPIVKQPAFVSLAFALPIGSPPVSSSPAGDPPDDDVPPTDDPPDDDPHSNDRANEDVNMDFNFKPPSRKRPRTPRPRSNEEAINLCRLLAPCMGGYCHSLYGKDHLVVWATLMRNVLPIKLHPTYSASRSSTTSATLRHSRA